MCQRGPVGDSGPSKCTGTRNPGQVPSMTLEGGQALAERGPRAGACACRRTCRQGSPHTASPSTERRSSPRAGSGAGVRCAATPRERRTRRRKRSVALPAAAMACAVSMAVGSESAQAVRGPRDGPAVCPATRMPLHEAIVAPGRTNVGIQNLCGPTTPTTAMPVINHARRRAGGGLVDARCHACGLAHGPTSCRG